MSQVNSIFILDNGAHTIKAGFADTDEDRDAALARLTSQRKQKGPWNSKVNKALAQELDDQVDTRYECVTVPNSIARSAKDKVTYVADELAQCTDFGGLVFRTPFERVCLASPDTGRPSFVVFPGHPHLVGLPEDDLGSCL
jgi:hypothetical protein